MILVLFIAIPALFIYVVGFLFVVDKLFTLFDKVAKHITDKYHLWGIMREANRIYRSKKSAKQEAE